MFLKLMDASADTIETHFALGALYRRRGEVERAIRIHQNLLAREALAPEHREQALLALAQDYLRAGLLDRAEGLFQQVSEVPRLRASALAALRGVYERQHEWQQALDTYRQLARIKAAPPRRRGRPLSVRARHARHRARRDRRGAASVAPGARGVDALSARRAAARANRGAAKDRPELAMRLLRSALRESPELAARGAAASARISWAPSAAMRCSRNSSQQAQSRDLGELKRLVFAAIAADLASAAPLRAAIETVFTQDATLQRRLAGGRRAGRAHRARDRCAARARRAISVQRVRLRGAQLLLALPGVSVVGELRVLRHC